jgi:hypothetical protein
MDSPETTTSRINAAMFNHESQASSYQFRAPERKRHQSSETPMTTDIQTPKVLKQLINKTAYSLACIHSSYQQIKDQIKLLELHQQEESIPKHLEIHNKTFKEMDIITAKPIYEQLLKNEINKLKTKILELNSKAKTVRQDFTEIIQKCNTYDKLKTEDTDFQSILEYTFQERILEFELRKREHATKKALKEEKFKTKKDKEQEPALLSMRDKNRLEQKIKTLETKIKGLTLNGKGTNKKKRPARPNKEIPKKKLNAPKQKPKPKQTAKPKQNQKGNQRNKQ